MFYGRRIVLNRGRLEIADNDRLRKSFGAVYPGSVHLKFNCSIGCIVRYSSRLERSVLFLIPVDHEPKSVSFVRSDLKSRCFKLSFKSPKMVLLLFPFFVAMSVSRSSRSCLPTPLCTSQNWYQPVALPLAHSLVCTTSLRSLVVERRRSTQFEIDRFCNFWRRSKVSRVSAPISTKLQNSIVIPSIFKNRLDAIQCTKTRTQRTDFQCRSSNRLQRISPLPIHRPTVL